MKQIIKNIFKKNPMLYKIASFAKAHINKPNCSTKYAKISRDDVYQTINELKDSWKNEKIPKRQLSLVQRQIAEFKNGKRVDVFNGLIDIIRRNINDTNGFTVLEIGCSSGYYSEVFNIAGLNLKYEGCDYSPPFITLAQQLYPNTKFSVQDATELQYGNGEFDIVISGCCLLHIKDYPVAIKEAERVSKRYVIFHRTPVLKKSATTFFTKEAYGIPTFEIHFNEDELLQLLKSNNLDVVDEEIISETDMSGDILLQKTYFCIKGMI